MPAGAVFFARVADDDVVVHRDGDLRQEARQLAGAYDQQAPARSMQRHHLPFIHLHHGAVGRLRQFDRAAVQVQRALHQLMALQPFQQLCDAAVRGQRFNGQFDGAAAGQAEAVRLVGADAVADDFRHAALDAVRAHVGDQVVLDAAARDGTYDAAVVADGQRGADRARTGTPGLDDGDQLAAVAGGDPVGAGFQYFEVDAVHAVILRASLRNTACGVELWNILWLLKACRKRTWATTPR